MVACTNQRGYAATGSCWSSAEEDAGGGLVEEDSKLSPVTSSSALIGSNPDEEVVQEEATPESGQMAATRTNQRGAITATGTSCGSVLEEDGGNRDEEDSKPFPVKSSALPMGSYPAHQEVVVQEEATTPDEIPSGWTRVKLEPDC
jgi:hypothetical protein